MSWSNLSFFLLHTRHNGAYVRTNNVKTPDEPESMNSPKHEAEEEIDVSLLEDSLRLTPWQRLLENERALALVRMLEAAHVTADGTSKSDP